MKPRLRKRKSSTLCFPSKGLQKTETNPVFDFLVVNLRGSQIMHSNYQHNIHLYIRWNPVLKSRKWEVIMTRQFHLKKQIDVYYNPGCFHDSSMLYHPIITTFSLTLQIHIFGNIVTPKSNHYCRKKHAKYSFYVQMMSLSDRTCYAFGFPSLISTD